MSTDKELRAMRLRMARAHAGFDHPTDAAKRFNWPISTYLSHENGSRGIRPIAAKRYAQGFKISLSWLMTGEGSMTNPGIDAELLELPVDQFDELTKQFRRMIAAAKQKTRGKIS